MWGQQRSGTGRRRDRVGGVLHQRIIQPRVPIFSCLLSNCSLYSMGSTDLSQCAHSPAGGHLGRIRFFFFPLAMTSTAGGLQGPQQCLVRGLCSINVCQVSECHSELVSFHTCESSRAQTSKWIFWVVGERTSPALLDIVKLLSKMALDLCRKKIF